MSDIKDDVKPTTPLGAVWEALVKYQAIVVPIVAVALAFGIGSILISFQGVNPSYAYN